MPWMMYNTNIIPTHRHKSNIKPARTTASNNKTTSQMSEDKKLPEKHPYPGDSSHTTYRWPYQDPHIENDGPSPHDCYEPVYTNYAAGETQQSFNFRSIPQNNLQQPTLAPIKDKSPSDIVEFVVETDWRLRYKGRSDILTSVLASLPAVGNALSHTKTGSST